MSTQTLRRLEVISDKFERIPMITFQETSRKAGQVSDIFDVRSSIVPLSKSQPPCLLMFGKCWISLQLEPPIQGDWPPVGLPRHLLPISPQTSPRQSATTETNPPESSKNFIVSNASFDLRSVTKLVHKLPCCTLHFLIFL